MGERERGKGLFFCHIVVWSFYSKNKRKGWVFMTMSILGLYQLFDNFDQRESGIIVTAYRKGLMQYMGLGLRRTDWYDWQSLIKRQNCYSFGIWTKKDWEMEFVQYFDQEMTFICPTPLPFLKNTLSPVILMVVRN